MSKKLKLGLSPGSLVYVGRAVDDAPSQLRVIKYCEKTYDKKIVQNLDIDTTNPAIVIWLDVDGIHDHLTVEKAGEAFKIHPLALEDIMNTNQAAKIEFYDDPQVFVQIKMLHLKGRQRCSVDTELVSFVLGNNYLVSFQEKRETDIFLPIVDRLQASVGKTRKNNADYLLFALMDLIIDNYLEVVEAMGERIDQLENSIFDKSHKDPIPELYALKREFTLIRKHVWPVREVLQVILRGEADSLNDSTLPYFRDLLDHVDQVLDNITSYRELLTSLVDIHYSMISNRMNSVMKTLTIYSAVFMPLTFIAGIYGMNFDNMPELHQRNGYFIAWGVMITIVVGLLFFFRRRGWL
jgi:magnesium transporter